MNMWLDEVLEEIHAHARAGRVELTDKAFQECERLDLQLDTPDVIEILLALQPRDFRQRLSSEIPAEWLYVFKPRFWRITICIKIALREQCVVISFHEDDLAKRIYAERSTTKAPRPKPKRLPIDICTTCGSKMEFVTGPIREVVNGESFWIPDVAHHNCARCGNKLFSIQICQVMIDQGNALYRQRHHLLSGAEILAIRKQLKLTQVQLAALLKLGSNTLSRWESGRIVQSAAMDTLLRLLRDVPGTLPYLRKRARTVA